MADNKKTPLWLDRHQILDPAHADWLETQAAISEFGNGMPREEAEAKAYADYKRKHSAQAAAHHLAGMRAASGEEAKQHGAMYALHCKQLGCDPSGPVPDEVKAFLNSDDFKHPVRFSAHKADSFVLDTPKPVEQMGKNELDPEYMATLYRTAKLATILGELAKSVKLNKFDDDYEDGEEGDPVYPSRVLPSEEINHSAYGWWIRPDGGIINIDGDDSVGDKYPHHDDAAPEIKAWATDIPEFQDVDFFDTNARMFAEDMGFVRAVRGHGFSIHKPLNDLQRATVAKLWHHFDGGNIDVGTQNRDTWDTSTVSVPIPIGSNPARMIDHAHRTLQHGTASGEPSPLPVGKWATVGTDHIMPLEGQKYYRVANKDNYWYSFSDDGPMYDTKKKRHAIHSTAEEAKDFVNRFHGKNLVKKSELAKALVPPVAQAPALHSTAEGFAGGLKALPKGSPERLRFITKHMSHAPFLRALQAHPQGKALHGQLMGILNSHANAGLRPGATVATAKNELAKGEVANSPSFFLDEEHQLPTHLETEGYRLHLSHNGADVHMGTVHRGGKVVGRVELVPGGFREEWNNPRHGLDSAVKMVLSAHANRQPVVDGWNNAMFSAGVPVAKMAKAAPGFTGKVQGAEVTSPHSTYAEASAAKPKNMSAHGNKNLWVRQSSDGNNSNRTLMVQFSSDLLQGNRQRDHSDDYYDKLYKNREGYHRPDDFWELPQWQAHLANSMPNADHYTIRDPKEAVAFANAAGYKNVAFSALDVNRDFVKEFAQGYKGNVVVGGYTDMSHFAGLPNVKVHNTIQDFVESEGGQYNPGYDYRHFSGTKTIPRLTLSDGCAHKCAFCCVPKQVTEKTRDEIMQQVDSFSKHLPSDLIYLNDKTFGQAPNHAMLPEIYQRIKAANPNFKGFVVQTTAAQLKKMDPEFLRKAGIRHVEIGVESYNDSILRAHKKPANEQLIDESAQKLRNAGIGLIPNIMVGLPGEDQNTYKRTMDWLNRNSDIVSHVNAYNLALYDESELGKKIGALSNADKDENQITKSFHVNPQVHKDFANELFAYASRQLDKHPNVVIKAEGAKPKVKAKAWKSKDGITIPHHGTPERAEWDKRFRQALIENFAGGNAARLKPVKVDPNLATTTNMPVNKARLELYKQMAKKDKLPPIIVRKAGRGYVVIDGNHRFAAAVDAKLPHVDGYELVMPK